MDRILMFSGGLDSLLIKELHGFKNEECLFVRMGTQENENEERFIDTYFPGVIKVDCPLSVYELGNKIVPFRNYFLTLIGAQYAPNIYFGYTAGDTTRDKDYVYKGLMESLLNYFTDIPEKAPFERDQPYQIQMPFKFFTKTEILEMYIRQGYDLKILSKSPSCYYNQCGKCRSCLRRYVAFFLNGLGIDFTPSLLELDELLTEAIRKDRKKEIKEIKKCINLRQQ